jgi:hypothetical protein
MHATANGGKDAMKKLKGIAAAFFGALIHRVASYYAVGIMYDWHVFTWLVSALPAIIECGTC